jgi:hypothetical protein
MGDGISLVQLFLKVLSDKDGQPVPLPGFIRAAKPRLAVTSPNNARQAEIKQQQQRSSPLSQIQKLVKSIGGAILKVASLPATGDDTKTAIRDTSRPFKWTQPRTLVLVSMS